jgi:hypothetical protein
MSEFVTKSVAQEQQEQRIEARTAVKRIGVDRLVSFLVCVGEIQPDSRQEKCSFGQLIQLWMKRMPEAIPVPCFADLRSAVDEWRIHRNQVVHGMVKSMPDAHHCDVLDFLKEAEFAALQGEALAHAVSDWVRKEKRRFLKANEHSSATPS